MTIVICFAYGRCNAISMALFLFNLLSSCFKKSNLLKVHVLTFDNLSSVLNYFYLYIYVGLLVATNHYIFG